MALALRPDDVRLAAHTVRVLYGKGDKATTRGLPRVPWPTPRPAGPTLATPSASRTGTRFCTLQGRPAAASTSGNLPHRLGDRAGVDKRVHPHGLRHTFAVELEAPGTPGHVISKLSGHSSTTVTSRYLDRLTNVQPVAVLEGVSLPPLEDCRPGSGR